MKKDETFSSVATVVELTPEMNRLLSQAAARSRRSKTQEATIRLFDHLRNFPDIATEGRRFRENN
ncbi:TraY domain-containing protein [Arsenophonus nasoniae]|uniref:Relaxosome protein TraY n=1 Tax=Arsenophonus nasoniae TaxID=638 RepID=A0AA95GD82_9GAMM|nr:TraY domain-containing protein [Arsenophonus nasoniae]WGL94030.1 TraY domain-containing protein [Arsenophonus nasoniae]